MLKGLIVCLLLLLIGCVLLLSGREIDLKNEKTYLIAEASIISDKNLDFKLSFDSNRVRIRRKSGFLPFLSGSSYYPRGYGLHSGKFCSNSTFDELAFKSSLEFSQGMKIPDLQLIYTDDPSVSDWFDWNGILGLNPFEGCEKESDSLDSLAPINQLRGNYSGFILDTNKLTFTNEFPQDLEMPSDGMYFEMEQIAFGHYNFGGVAMKGKIDLEFRFIKIPARYFDEIWREFEFLNEMNHYFDDKASRFETKVPQSDIQISIRQPSQGKSLNLPLERYWERETIEDLWGFFVVHCVDAAIVKHDEPYWSFGLMFLEDFRVHWDFKRKKIGFQPIKSH